MANVCDFPVGRKTAITRLNLVRFFPTYAQTNLPAKLYNFEKYQNFLGLTVRALFQNNIVQNKKNPVYAIKQKKIAYNSAW